MHVFNKPTFSPFENCKTSGQYIVVVQPQVKYVCIKSIYIDLKYLQKSNVKILYKPGCTTSEVSNISFK